MLDLHFHSSFSDGFSTPDEIVRKAKELNLKFIALTDHDTLKGVSLFLEACRDNNILGVSGVEITSKLDNFDLHILGYNVDLRNKDLLDNLEFLTQSRLTRGEKTVRKLKNLGFNISLKDVQKVAGPNSNIGKLHIASALLKNKRNLIKAQKEIKRKPTLGSFMKFYLEYNGPAFVDKEKLPAEKSIQLVNNAGGIACLSHPGENLKAKNDFDLVIKKLATLGLKGLEVYSPKNSPNDISFYQKICQRLGLLETAGSDAHTMDLKDSRSLGKINFYSRNPQILINNFLKAL